MLLTKNMLKITDQSICEELLSHKGQEKESRAIIIRSNRMQYKNNSKQNKEDLKLLIKV